MKKLIAIMLCLIMLPGCAAVAETAEKTHLAKVNMGGAFELKCALPEGYEISEIESTDSTYVASIMSDQTRPRMYLSIAYNELYADIARFNDMNAEAVALIEKTFESEEEVEITYTETAHGTKLMMVKEVKDAVDFVDFYSVYQGYEIEIVVTAANESGLTDEQIQMAVGFLSELDFVAAE